VGLPAIELSTHTAEIGPGEYVVTVGGEVDLHSAPGLRGALDDVLAAGARTLVLDLREVLFIDSTGMGVVTSAVKRLRVDGGSFVVASDRPEVLRVFRLTGLDRFITVRSSLTAAMDEIRGRSA
jgi:anti-sigma B factor antagonist